MLYDHKQVSFTWHKLEPSARIQHLGCRPIFPSDGVDQRCTLGPPVTSLPSVFLPNFDRVWLMGLDRRFQEEQEKIHLEKVLGSEALQDRISTLTTEESMDLYCSYFSKVCNSAVEDPLVCEGVLVEVETRVASQPPSFSIFFLLLRRCSRMVRRKELVEHILTQVVPRTGFKTTGTEMDRNILSWWTKTFSPARNTRYCDVSKAHGEIRV